MSDLSVDVDNKAIFTGLKKSMVYRETNANYEPPKIIKKVITNILRPEEAEFYVNFRTYFIKIYQLMTFLLMKGRKIEARQTKGVLLAMVTYLRLTLVAPIVALDALARNYIKYKIKNKDLQEILFDLKTVLLENRETKELESKPSSRLEQILFQIKEYSNRRIVIYFSFRKMLNKLKDYLDEGKKEEEKRVVLTLKATDNITERQEVLNKFSASDNGILLLTYDIGANGLNLQSGSVVFITEYWWNSGKTTQALARVNRMGQKHSIIDQVYFTSGTAIEKTLLEKSKDKLEIYKELLTGYAKTEIKKMEFEEMYKLISEEVNNKLIENIYKKN